MSRLTLRQFLEQNSNNTEFIDSFYQLCDKCEIKCPVTLKEISFEDDKKKKRKYPDCFDDLTDKHKEELAKIGFSRITKRRKGKAEESKDKSDEDLSEQNTQYNSCTSV